MIVEGRSSYPEEVERVLVERIHLPDEIFVFPSEIVADSWQQRLLETGAVRALRRDRFLSWDRMKERYFSPYLSSRPANLMFRSLFASRLLSLEDGAEFPFRDLINPRYPEQAPRFVGWISGLLPQLRRAMKIIEEEESNLPGDFVADVSYLYKEYADFLSRYGLFEPAWQEPDSRETAAPVHLFFPELIEDYEELRPLLAGNSGFIVHPMRSIAGAEPSGPGIKRFTSAWEELEAALERLGELLEEGVSPSDITISLPSYEAWMPFLDEAARLRDIPLHFRSGSRLSDFPVGRLFRSLKELEASGFAHSAVKNLFLDPRYPWRRREQWRSLIRFGVEHSCIRSHTGSSGRYDPWKGKLKRTGESRLEGLYESFRSELKSLLESGSYEELNAKIVGFLTSWFEDELWGGEERKVLQYSLLQLRKLAEAEDVLHGDWSPSDPFGLWLSILDQSLYVPTFSGVGVSVYRYRVAAGVYPRYHFILGAGQEETRVLFDTLSFLREDRRGGIEAGAKDLSIPYIEAYSRSGGEVYCSCSDAGFSGPQLPPAEFLSPERVSLGGVIEGSIVHSRDRYRAEQRAWFEEAPLPAQVHRGQAAAFRSISSTGFNRKNRVYTRGHIEDARLKEAMFSVIRKENGLFRFSPNGLDSYRGCHFSYYLYYALGIEAEEYEPGYEDPRVAGILAHRALELLFISIRDGEGSFQPDKLEEYRVRAHGAVETSLQESEGRGLDLFPPEWRRLRSYLHDAMERFLEVEAATFPLFRVEALEKEADRSFPGRGVELSGRMDRVSSINGRPAVVDYKNGKLPLVKTYVPKGGGLPERTQMPIYLLLAEALWPNAAAISYYSVKQASYSHLLYEGPSGEKEKLGAERLGEIAGEVVEEAAKARHAIERGDFLTSPGCDPCDFRALCRSKYSIRTPGDT